MNTSIPVADWRRLFQHVAALLEAMTQAEAAVAARPESASAARILELHLARLAGLAPSKRERWPPMLRANILHLMREHHKGIAWVAENFAVGKKTVRRWIADAHSGKAGDAQTVAFNRLDDQVRGAVHAARGLLGKGASIRRIATQLIRHGIRISRETVRRILLDEPPKEIQAEEPAVEAQAPSPTAEVAPAEKTLGPLKPEGVNEAWHLDMTQVEGFWSSFFVLGVMDGFSRRCLALRVFAKDLTTQDILGVVRELTRKHGKPTTICTDHGGQLKKRFTTTLKDELGIGHTRGKPGNPCFNGKIERLFKTAKGDLLPILHPKRLNLMQLQRTLDDYSDWYNHGRPHQSLGGLTPAEAWRGQEMKPAVAYRSRDQLRLRIKTTRTNHRGLSCCPILKFEVNVQHPIAA